MEAQLQTTNSNSSVSASADLVWSRVPFLTAFRRVALAAAFALHPKRARELPCIALLALRDRWGKRPVSDATWKRRPIDAAGGVIFLSSDLSVENLINAYSRGIFPYCHVMPAKWWSPPKRMLLAPASIKIENDVRRLLKGNRLDVCFDKSFKRVVEACAAPRRKLHLTWISSAIIEAYVRLHQAGYAHSVEVYEDGRLVGGLYGVAVGSVFFTESQFSIRRNGSKVALAALNAHLLEWGFTLNDGKARSSHLERCGFELKPREVLQEALRSLPPSRAPGEWRYSRDLVLKQFTMLRPVA